MNAKKSLVNFFSDLASVEKVEKGTKTELEAGGRRQQRLYNSSIRIKEKEEQESEGKGQGEANAT